MRGVMSIANGFCDVLLNRVTDEPCHDTGGCLHLSRVVLERSPVPRCHLRIGLIIVVPPLINPVGDVLNADQAKDVQPMGAKK